MNITKAEIKDAKEISEIAIKCNFETERNYEEILNDKDKGIFLAKENNKIIGFIGYSFQKWNNSIQVINIFVKPDFRKKGIGSRLIQELINFSKKTDYRVIIAEAPSNTNAPKLYLKNGFRKCGYNDRYYTNDGSIIAEFYSLDL